MHPEPLIGILTDHCLKSMIEKLSVGLHILLHIFGMNQFKRLLNQQTMLLESIPYHKNRQNRKKLLGSPFGCQKIYVGWKT